MQPPLHPCRLSSTSKQANPSMVALSAPLAVSLERLFFQRPSRLVSCIYATPNELDI